MRRTSPRRGGISPRTVRRNAVFPQPFGPRTASLSPAQSSEELSGQWTLSGVTDYEILGAQEVAAPEDPNSILTASFSNGFSVRAFSTASSILRRLRATAS